MRLRFALAIATLIVFFLGYRLIRIQLFEGEEYKKGALQQWTKAIDITSERGIIYDRKGKKLVVNTTAYNVWAAPSDIKDPEVAALQLGPLLGIESEELYKRLTSESSLEKLKRWVTREEAEQIRNLGFRGISVVDDSKRYYPFGSFGSYVLGFTDIDNRGLYGIEKVYDTYLSGTPGVWVKATDAANRQLPYDGEQVYDAEDGLSVVLTMDETIQGFAEDAAEKALVANRAKSVSIIVMDPETGEVLAMANKPDYDPNAPRDRKSTRLNSSHH